MTNRLSDLANSTKTDNRLTALAREEQSFRGVGATGTWEEEYPKLVAGKEPTVLDDIKQYIREKTGYFEPPIYGKQYREEQPLRTLGKLTGRQAAAVTSGIGLYLPDVIAKYTKGDITAEESVDRMVGFEATPKEKQIGEVLKFFGAAYSVNKIGALLGILGGAPKYRTSASQIARIIESGKLGALIETPRQLSMLLTGSDKYEGAVAPIETGALFAGLHFLSLGATAAFKSGWSALMPSERAKALRTLGLKEGATVEEIQKAYKKSAQAKNFNFGTSRNPTKARKLANEFTRITKARDTLLKKTQDVVTAKGKPLQITGKTAEPVKATRVTEPTGVAEVPAVPAAKPERLIDRELYKLKKGEKPITKETREALKAKGYTVAEIARLSPTEAKGIATDKSVIEQPTVEEARAIDIYLRDSHFINLSLRNPFSKGLSQEQQKVVDVMDKLISQGDVSKEELFVYRAIPKENIPEGETFIDPGFVSATFSKAASQDPGFVHPADRVTLNIKVPAGTKYLRMEEAAKAIGNEKAEELARQEKEVIFGRNTKFRILGRSETGKDVFVEIVPKDMATNKQKLNIHRLARQKGLVNKEGVTDKYKEIAKSVTGKESSKDMTSEEADRFIEFLKTAEDRPDVLQRMARKYGEPTLVTHFTDPSYYAEKLGVKSLIAPIEKAKAEFDLELRSAQHELDKQGHRIDKVWGTTAREKARARVKNIPTKAKEELGKLLDTYEEAPEGLDPKKKEVFDWFRKLTRTMLERQNEARAKLDLPPIVGREAYMRHVVTDAAREILRNRHPFPEESKYWSKKVIAQRIYNPMELQRTIEDDLFGIFTKDPVRASKAMVHTALKEIYLNEPIKFFKSQLSELNKNLPQYEGLTSEQMRIMRNSVLPASTRKWLDDYVNELVIGQETQADEYLNNLITKTGIRSIINTALKPFGRILSQKPATNFFSKMGRLQMAGVLGPRPKLILRNKFQLTQNLALYTNKANIRAFLPASEQLKELLSESVFLRSYTGLEELPKGVANKVENLWHKGYRWSAVSNARQAMECAYHDTLELIENPKYKGVGFADPQRTYTEPKEFLYPSERAKILREMEFGASATQYNYTVLGMPWPLVG